MFCCIQIFSWLRCSQQCLPAAKESFAVILGKPLDLASNIMLWLLIRILLTAKRGCGFLLLIFFVSTLMQCDILVFLIWFHVLGNNELQFSPLKSFLFITEGHYNKMKLFWLCLLQECWLLCYFSNRTAWFKDMSMVVSVLFWFVMDLVSLVLFLLFFLNSFCWCARSLLIVLYILW